MLPKPRALALTICLALLIGATVSADSLRLINVKVSGKNCTGAPLTVVAKDDAIGSALRAEVRVQWSEWDYGVRNDVYLEWTDATSGAAAYTPAEAGTYYILVSRPGYLPFSTTLKVRDCPECLADSDCRDDQLCEGGKCANITGGCGYAAGHSWHDYECCEDSGCAGDEYCLENKCEKIAGECGYAEGHEWRAYTCCEDTDCAPGSACIEHACVKKTGCAEDNECLGSQRCADGTCVNIVGECGYAAGHSWNQYECCEDGDCGSGWCLPDNTCSAVARAQAGTPQQAAVGAALPLLIAATGAFLLIAVFLAGAFLLLPRLMKKAEEKPKQEKRARNGRNGGA